MMCLDNGGDPCLQFQAGPGFLLDLGTQRVALRAEVLGRWVDIPGADQGGTDVLFNLGVQLAFGKSTQ